MRPSVAAQVAGGLRRLRSAERGLAAEEPRPTLAALRTAQERPTRLQGGAPEVAGAEAEGSRWTRRRRWRKRQAGVGTWRAERYGGCGSSLRASIVRARAERKASLT